MRRAQLSATEGHLRDTRAQLEALTNEHTDACATVRVVQRERATLKEEWTQMFVSTDGLKARIEELHREHAASVQQLQVRPPCCVCCFSARFPAPQCHTSL